MIYMCVCVCCKGEIPDCDKGGINIYVEAVPRREKVCLHMFSFVNGFIRKIAPIKGFVC